MKGVSWWTTQAGILLVRALAWLPLPVLRGLGWALAWILFRALTSRRRIVLKNLSVAFPELSADQSLALARAHFVVFVQAALDRAWLWHGPAWMTLRRLRLTGAVQDIRNPGAVVLFTPHFVGLDAAGIAVTQQINRPMVSIYANQTNPVVDAWVFAGRRRFGNMKLFDRSGGVKEIVEVLRQGGMLSLSPDMGFGIDQSVYAPFFNVVTTTSPSLSRFSRLGKARVIPIVAIMTPTGYDIEVKPPIQDFPSRDSEHDALRMNQVLESYIRLHPSQYFWVHKRYKHRPPGEPSIYD